MKKLLLASAVLASSSYYYIQTAQAIELDPVNVTADTLKDPVQSSIMLTQVVDKEHIQQSGAQSATDALKLISSVHIVQTGGEGSQTSIFTRGTESDHTLILLNGVELNAVNGAAFLNTISVESIERIEVIKGASSRYGSDAIGGVINIITIGSESNNSVRLSTSTQEHNAASFFLNHFTNNTQLSANLGTEYNEGFDSIEGIDPDEDSYKNTFANVLIDHAFTDTFYATAQYSTGQSRTQYDNGWQGDESEVDQNIGSLRIGYQTDIFQTELSGSDRLYISDQFFGKTESIGSHFASRNQTLALDNQFNYRVLTLNFGGKYQKETSNQVAFEDLHQGSLYLQPQLRLAPFTIEGIYNYNRNSDFKNMETFGANIRYTLNANGYIQAGFNQGYKYPTALDNYFGSSPGLVPEKSDNISLMINQTISALNAHLTLFRNDVDNLIAYDFVSGRSFNTSEAKIQGAELGLTYSKDRFYQSIEFTALRTEDANGNPLQRRPSQNISFLGAYQALPNFQVHWLVEAQSDTSDFAGDIGGFAVYSAGFKYDPIPSLSLSFDLKNIFDKKYTTANTSFFDADSGNYVNSYFNQLGITGFIGATVSF